MLDSGLGIRGITTQLSERRAHYHPVGERAVTGVRVTPRAAPGQRLAASEPARRSATQNGRNHAGWGWRVGLRISAARCTPARCQRKPPPSAGVTFSMTAEPTITPV